MTDQNDISRELSLSDYPHGQQPHQQTVYIIQDQRPFSAQAIVGFVTAVLPFTQLLGFLFSIIALRDIKNKNQRGGELATAGLVLSIIFLIPVVVLIFYWTINSSTELLTALPVNDPAPLSSQVPLESFLEK